MPAIIPEELYPFKGRFHEVGGGIRMHYLDEGQGPFVLMVHGNPTWSFYYRNLVRALSGEHRCIVPDHIGCGLSDKPGDEDYSYRLDRRIEDLDSLMSGLAGDAAPRSVDLVVHDWGGLIGLGWAVRHPELIRRIVVFNTAAFHLPSGKAVPWQLRLVRNSAFGVFLVRAFNAFACGAARVAMRAHPMSSELRRAYCAPYDSWKNRIATARFVQDIPLDPSDPGYDTISRTADGLKAFRELPVLICWGEKDFVFDHYFREEFERRFPGADVHRFERAGHYVLEDAADEIIPLVAGFLEV